MTYTGGELNVLNGQCGASNPSNSVHVMSLIRNHDPSNPDELEQLIRDHHEHECDCGIESGGTVEDFGRMLYEAQQEHWDEYRYSLEECIDWEYDLFVMQSLKGHSVESDALDELQDEFDGARLSTSAEDDEYRVDIVIESDGEPVAGIQVKPQSYRNMRSGVKFRNREANEQVDFPVLYLYYDYDSEMFTNMDFVVVKIREMVDDGTA